MHAHDGADRFYPDSGNRVIFAITWPCAIRGCLGLERRPEMPRYVEASCLHAFQRQRCKATFGFELPVDRERPVLLPYLEYFVFVRGVLYPSFWAFVKHTKNPLLICRVVLSMIIGRIAEPILAQIADILRK